MSRIRRGTVAGVVLSAVVLLVTGCQWSFARGDIAGTGNNRFDRSTGIADVADLAPEWSAPLGIEVNHPTATPVAWDRYLFVTDASPTTSRLLAFDAAGSTGCTGSPVTCVPLWQATAPATDPFDQPSVVNGTVFVNQGVLRAFDADGVDGCAGTPTVCQPLWSGTGAAASMVVADGILFGVSGSSTVDAYAAFDTNACSGTPQVCAPIRTYEHPSFCSGLAICSLVGPVAIRGDRLYVGVRHRGDDWEAGAVATYDRTGSTGCSGVPVVCTKIDVGWSGYLRPVGLAAVEDGYLSAGQASDFEGGSTAGIELVRDGAQVWSAPLSSTSGLAIDDSSAFVADGSAVRVFPLAATCGPCLPIRSYAVTGTVRSAPVLANGLLYVGTATAVQVFDATGATGCTAAPVVCSPLRTVELGSSVEAIAITNGRVLVTGGGVLTSLRVEP